MSNESKDKVVPIQSCVPGKKKSNLTSQDMKDVGRNLARANNQKGSK